jgi:hypothetical protein
LKNAGLRGIVRALTLRNSLYVAGRLKGYGHVTLRDGICGHCVLVSQSQQIILLITRQGGKSTVSSIRALHNEATIRGFSGVAPLIVDEASRVSDELYQAIRPMLAASGGEILLLSTPFGKRGFQTYKLSGSHKISVIGSISE